MSLPQLPLVDLLSIAPDITDINIWRGPLNKIKVPYEIGCYAFYEATMDKVVYVGSCGSRNTNGLNGKMRAYKGLGPNESPSSTIKRIREANVKTLLLVKMWFCDSVSDALKYEADTIIIHKPIFNHIWAKTLSPEESKKRRRKIDQNRAATFIEENDFNPSRIKICSICKIAKQHSEFARDKSAKYGVKYLCKSCYNSQRRAREALQLIEGSV